MTCFVLSPASAFAGFGYITHWGRFDTSGANQLFNGPVDVSFLKSNGNMLIVDSNAGVTGGGEVVVQQTDGTYVTKIAALNDQGPVRAATDPNSGDVYIGTYYESKVRHYTEAGGTLTLAHTWTGCTANGGFGPYAWGKTFGVAVDSTGAIYVGDYDGLRIIKMNSAGQCLATPITTYTKNGTPGQVFLNQTGLAVDSADNLWATDYGKKVIVKFDSSGNWLQTFTGYSNCGTTTSFSSPKDIDIDTATNDMFITDSGLGGIIKLDSSGNFLTKTTKYNTSTSFSVPFGGGFSSGLYYATDYGHNAVVKYRNSSRKVSVTAGANGTVSADVGGIITGTTGGNTCVDQFVDNTTVVLTATPSSGYLVTWGGADGAGCTGTTCTLSGIGADKVVTATFVPSSFTVGYDGNSNTGGSVPTDTNSYASGASVTVLSNSGSLNRTGYTFLGWNTAANGSGTDYAASGVATFTMGSANVTLYARWLEIPIAAAANAITHDSFSANWSAAAGATGYYLDVATDSGFTSFVTGFNNLDVSSVTSKAITGLSVATPYYYRVRAYNSGGTGGNSDTITALTVPGDPTATSATAVTLTGFTANWGSVSGASGYRLDVATDSGFTSPVAGYNDLDVGTVTTHAVSGLTAGSSYHYRVRAYNGSGSGGNSNSITVLPRYTVTPSSGAHGAISPDTLQTVLQGGSASFTITPDSGYHIDGVTGCGGTLTDNSYSTGAITTDCTVTASFAINSYSVTPSSGGHGAISCSSPVNHGASSTCTITPDPGYRLTALTANGSDILASVTLDQASVAITQATTVTATFSAATYGGRAVTGGTSDIGLYATVHATDGTQHLVYERDGSLYYRSSTGVSGSWSDEETVATGHDPAIALRQDGTPVVAFLAGGQIRTTSRSGGAWSGAADTGIADVTTLELAMDASDHLHLAYTTIGNDGYDDILYSNNSGGSFGAPATICDGAYAGGTWTFCRTPLIQADAGGNYHIVYNKQQVNSRLSEHDPQWMVYTTNGGGGTTISSHDLNSGSASGTPQPLARGAFTHDSVNGYTLVYGNDLESSGLWLATGLESGSWSESAVAVAGSLPAQDSDAAGQNRSLVSIAPDGGLQHVSKGAGGYGAIITLAPKGELPTVNRVKRSVLYRAADANGIRQLHQVGVGPLALLTPNDGNLGNVVLRQTTEKSYTLVSNGSDALTVGRIGTDYPGYTFDIGTDTCTGQTLVPGATCSFTVKNVPQEAISDIHDTLTMESNDPVRAPLTLALTAQILNFHYPLNLTLSGGGTVVATSSGQSDLSCTTGSCSRNYETNSIVTLTATVPTGSTFAGFTFTGDGSACCRGTSCSLTITGTTAVTATFTPNSYVVSTLTGAHGGLSCQSPVTHGVSSVCTLTPDSGYRIEGVGGSCGGTLNGATFTTPPLTGSCTVEAVFAPAPQRSVGVTVAGTGAGSVYSAPAGISCASGSCSQLFDDAIAVTLAAAADADSTFGGWSGSCTNGSGPCELLLTADRSVEATFTAAPKVRVGTSGFGTIAAAYGTAPNNGVIRARSVSFAEQLLFDADKRVTLEGGFNAPYDCNSCGDNTLLTGTLVVERGGLILENLTIR